MNRTIVKDVIINAYSKYQMSRNRSVEIKKIHEPSRVKIYDSIKFSKDQEEEINSLFRENLGEVVSHEWHREYTAYTGNFDYRYFPEVLYIPEFEKYMNPNDAYNSVFENKNILPALASSCHVNMPETISSSRNGYVICESQYGLTLPELAVNLLKMGGYCLLNPVLTPQAVMDV